eukprot:scaffold2267_cov92-Cylindrotheca_fusiformis.AAC.17
MDDIQPVYPVRPVVLKVVSFVRRVARFASELAQQDKIEHREKQKQNPKQQLPGRSTRLSNVVFMGMGEPLANYKNVKQAVQRIQSELGIGHRKITISTVGIVPNIYKLANDLPQVRLAVSLHCASDIDRTELLPANKRNGGLDALMQSLQDYISKTKRRITLEWALIEGENDTPEVAHQLGKLIQKWLRRDMVHVNVIPLNPTGGYGGSPSGRKRVNDFCQILENPPYGIACTPRVRRGIDIDAGCGQLTTKVVEMEKNTKPAPPPPQQPVHSSSSSSSSSADKNAKTLSPGALPLLLQEEEDIDDDDNDERSAADNDAKLLNETFSLVAPITADKDEVDKFQEEKEEWEDDTTTTTRAGATERIDFVLDDLPIEMTDDDDDWTDPVYETDEENLEVNRLINLVKGTTIMDSNSNSSRGKKQ